VGEGVELREVVGMVVVVTVRLGGIAGSWKVKTSCE